MAGLGAKNEHSHSYRSGGPCESFCNNGQSKKGPWITRQFIFDEALAGDITNIQDSDLIHYNYQKEATTLGNQVDGLDKVAENYVMYSNWYPEGE